MAWPRAFATGDGTGDRRPAGRALPAAGLPAMEAKVGRISAFTYTAISLIMAVLFWWATRDPVKYTPVARYGGTTWVFLLSMIVTMPLVTSYVKGRYHQGDA